jgi:AGCS family alanine or glycine:cation symporter
VAENVKIKDNNKLYTGKIPVKNGIITNQQFEISGESLINSAPLTIEAFKKGFFGRYGEYIVTIGILLFAFSTAISWSYYGDRAVTYLFGVKYVFWYRLIYIAGFFLASVVDTTIIWTFSGIAIAFMTLPNLVGILLLRKDMKQSIKDYWEDFKIEHPNFKK